VEVDTETGQVTVLEACSSHNLGKAIHRKVAEGQVSGGALLNIPRAHRLFIPIDPVTGTPLVTSDDGYAWATMVDDVMPIVNITEVPEPLGPMGAAPIGEKSVAGTSAAVMSAVFNAIGVWIDDKPLTPDKVLKALGKV
jgi:CO/xanthine dehydrogenase Mo-binding subunit